MALTCGRLMLVLEKFLQTISDSIYGFNQANTSALGKTVVPAPTPQVLH